MTELTNITPGVWVLTSAEHGTNSGVILGEHDAVVIDPGASSEEFDVVDGLLRERQREVAVVVLTEAPGEVPDLSRWTEARVVAPSMAEDLAEDEPALPVPGWQVVHLRGVPGVFGARERILFSGDVLSGEHIPDVRGGAHLYLDRLEVIERLDLKMVVPSSGTFTRGKRAVRERIERDRNYLNALLRHVHTTRAANVSLDHALQAARTVYEDYPFVEHHLENLRAVWDEAIRET